ncbi:hemolysin family protein [Streptomyces sp. NEAU-H3]|uniref:hemolysin family protein n=1 Tax=Streptomyces sp. NEAU-H3 TaxID=2720636 RepID=UPI0014391A2E|nr:hemolysin family protein [Streptomyces sp. NEAU-H3]NJA58814.1 HlyC/CorC family transporter [Streptomyces sp. NEAU-H3]
MIALQLLIGLATLVANAFFVGAEFALISVRRAQVEPRAEAGDRRARRVLWGLEHVSGLMAAAQLGITLCTLVLGIVAEPAIAHLLEPGFDAVGLPHGLVHPAAFVVALALATYLHMLLGEMIPKNVALADPVRAALWLGPPLVALTRALGPVIAGVNAVANGVLRLLRVEPRDEVAAAFSDEELARLVGDAHAAGLLDARSGRRLRDALALGRRPVRDVAIPPDRLVTAPLGTTPDGLVALAAASGYSRFPVADADGRPLGYLHVKDALGPRPADLPFAPRELRPLPRLAAGTPLDEALTALRAQGAHLAAVTAPDEGLVGLVTLEDVLRELIGRGTEPVAA